MAVVLAAAILVDLLVAGLTDTVVDLLLPEDHEAAKVVDMLHRVRAEDEMDDLIPDLAADPHVIERGQRRAVGCLGFGPVEVALPLIELQFEGNFQCGGDEAGDDQRRPVLQTLGVRQHGLREVVDGGLDVAQEAVGATELPLRSQGLIDAELPELDVDHDKVEQKTDLIFVAHDITDLPLALDNVSSLVGTPQEVVPDVVHRERLDLRVLGRDEQGDIGSEADLITLSLRKSGLCAVPVDVAYRLVDDLLVFDLEVAGDGEEHIDHLGPLAPALILILHVAVKPVEVLARDQVCHALDCVGLEVPAVSQVDEVLGPSLLTRAVCCLEDVSDGVEPLSTRELVW